MAEELVVTAIQIEKRLCEALQRPWSPAGISIESLSIDVLNEITRLRTQLSLKDKALEPFVKLLKAYEEDDSLFGHVENATPIVTVDPEGGEEAVLTIGDLRRAAKALHTEGK